MATQIAWIGLGNMGRGMCTNLVEKGNLTKPVLIFNRTKKRAEDLSSKLPSGKSVVADSVEEAVAKSDIIFSCVGDDAALTGIIDKAVTENLEGKLFVECSTVHPDTTAKVAETVHKKGAFFVASPGKHLFGAPPMADAGQLIFVLAGPAAQVDKVKPYTKGVMGRAIIDFSDQDFSKALLLKIIGNTMVLQMVESVSEGHTIAERSGLGVENLHGFIDTMFGGPFSGYSNRLRNGDYYKREEPLFAVDLALKDTRHALSLAAVSGVRMRAMEVVQQHLTGVKEHCGAKGDIAGIYGAVRQESGLKFEN